jgi:hypothetical protein
MFRHFIAVAGVAGLKPRFSLCIHQQSSVPIEIEVLGGVILLKAKDQSCTKEEKISASSKHKLGCPAEV